MQYKETQLTNSNDVPLMPITTENQVILEDGITLKKVLPKKQNITDNSLNTKDKTIIGSINELNDNIKNIPVFQYDNLGSIAEGYEFYRKNFEINTEVIDTGITPYSEENFERNFEFEIVFSTFSLQDSVTPFVVGNINTDGRMFGLKTDVENNTSYILFDHYSSIAYNTKIPINSNNEEIVTVKITRNQGYYEYYMNKGLKTAVQTRIAIQSWHPKNNNHLYIGGGSNTTLPFPMFVKYVKFRYFE